MKRVSITEELAYGSALERLTGGSKPPPVPKKETPEPDGPENVSTIKLSVFLRGEEDAYLENLASTAKFSGGKKLSKTRLIEAMVRAFKNSRLDVRGVKTDDDLLKRVLAQLR
ncbi:hypothetical protein ACFLVH_04300 [Chloroflexota bacterium]